MQKPQTSQPAEHRGFSDAAARALFAMECPDLSAPGPSGVFTLNALEHAVAGYRIDRLLCHGGMGAVYHGIQHSLEREVAIKLLPRALEDSDLGFGLRFEIEAKSLAKLHHPGIVAVIDAGETAEGLRFIVMEYVAGRTLQQRLLDDSRLPWAEALDIVTKVAEAIGFAHLHGIIHRDIKPSNILIGLEGQVKVADFGLARLHGAAISPTLTNVVMGSPDYMPPEAMAPGGKSDERSDIFSLAAMFYQILTGHLPRGRFELVSTLVPGADGRVDALLDKALQSDPARRHQDIQSFRAELAELQKSRGQRRAVVLAGVLTVAGMIALLAYPRGGAHSDSAGKPSAGSSGALAPLRTVNLLALLDPPQDARAGDWKRNEAGEITVAKGSAQSTGGQGVPRTRIRYQAPRDFDFEVEFTVAAGNDGKLMLLFPTGDHRAAWRLDLAAGKPDRLGFGDLDHLDLRGRREAVVPNPPAALHVGRNTTRIEVRQGRLRGWLNGKEMLSWTGDFSRFSTKPELALPGVTALGIALENADAVIHKAELIEFSKGGRELPAEPPGFPCGEWVSVLPGPNLVDTPSGDADLLGGGWHVPSARMGGTICFPPVMTSPGSNWGVRTTCRWTDAENPSMRISLRKQVHHEGVKDISSEINFEVHSDNAVFCHATGIDGKGAECRMLGDKLPLALKANEMVHIEAYAIGNTLIGKVNGVSVLCEIRSGLNTTGGCVITCARVPFRDPSVINLDGLSDEEARRIAGIP